MTPSHFTIEISEQVALIHFNRPEKSNAMSPTTWAELKDIFEQLSEKGEIRAAVLAGNGKHFCAGMDLNVFASGLTDWRNTEHGRAGEDFRVKVAYLQACITTIEKARFPVIAAVHGGCLGAGFDIITACDIRYGSEDAWFQVTETNIGMTADVGTLQRILHTLPSGLARELCYTGRKINAQEAAANGFLTQTAPSRDDIIELAMNTAKEIASKSPMSVYGCKHNLNYARDHGVDEALHYQTVWQAGQFHSDDMLEAITARFEGRDGKFPDLPNIESPFKK